MALDMTWKSVSVDVCWAPVSVGRRKMLSRSQHAKLGRPCTTLKTDEPLLRMISAQARLQSRLPQNQNAPKNPSVIEAATEAAVVTGNPPKLRIKTIAKAPL